MSVLTPAALARFEHEVDDEFLERATFYALNQLKGKTWKSAPGSGHLPGGKEAQDLVAEAAGDLLLGHRAWDPDQHPDLLKFFYNIIDSKVSHLATSAINRNETSPPQYKEEGGEQDFFALLVDRQTPTPADQAMIREEEARNEAIFSALLDFFPDDRLVQDLLGCCLEGLSKRAEIAARLKVSEQEITNARKRLERKLPEFREKHLSRLCSPTP